MKKETLDKEIKISSFLTCEQEGGNTNDTGNLGSTKAGSIGYNNPRQDGAPQDGNIGEKKEK